MTTSLKTALVMTTTLVIGMILGGLIYGTLMRAHIKRTVFQMRNPAGLINRFERDLRLDDNQRKAVQQILEKHNQRMLQLRMESRLMMDSLRVEMVAILTDEQTEFLRNAPFFRRNDRFRPPFPPGFPKPEGRPRWAPDSSRWRPDRRE